MRGWSYPIAVALILGLSVGQTGCDSKTAPEDAPDGHTTVKDGIPHAPGLNNPTESCVGCHGTTLEGGDGGEPSCFSCHGQEWRFGPGL